MIRRRTAARAAVALGVTLLIAASCSTDDNASSSSTPSTETPTISVATVPDAPPTTTSYIAPTTLRSLPLEPVDAGTAAIYPAGPATVLAVRTDADPASVSRSWWMVDVVTGAPTSVDPPPVDEWMMLGGFLVTDGHGYLVATGCQANPDGCGTPEVEVWRLDLGALSWQRATAFSTDDLIGESTYDAWITVSLYEIDDEGRPVLILSDESEQNPTRRLVLDVHRGVVREERPTRPPPRDEPCRTDTGLEARVGPEGGHLQLRSEGEAEWRTYPSLAPAFMLTCAAETVWTLADDRWVDVAADGTEISSTPVAGLRDTDVVWRRPATLEDGTNRVGLAMVLGRHPSGKQGTAPQSYELVVVAGPGSPPLTELLGPGAGIIQPEVVRLPGGRLVALVYDQYPEARLVVAE